MKEIVTSGTICIDDGYKFTYHVAEIKYVEREDGEYYYEITPDYSVIELLSAEYFQGIPGINLDLKKKSYIRKNIVPIFISERTPGENREDLWELLEKYNMEYLNRLEWLIRTDMRYSGDLMYVSKTHNEDIHISSIDKLGNRSAVICRKVLEAICAGGNIITDDFEINSSNRKSYYKLFMAMYKKEKKFLDEKRKEGISRAASNGKYKGKPEIKIDELELKDVCEQYKNGEISGKKAAEILNVSVSTFYRRYRKVSSQKLHKFY